MSITLRPWYIRLFGKLADFLGNTPHIAKVKVTKKLDNCCLATPGSGPMGPGRGPGRIEFLVFVMTHLGETKINVSKSVFDVITEGDQLIVYYWQSRFSGVVNATIAR